MPAIEWGGGAASVEGGGRAASIEGLRPYGRKVRQPLKGCALTKIGSANTSIPSPFPSKKRTSHGRFVSSSGVRLKKPKLPRFGAMILDEERVFGESRRWERTLVRDQWRLSPKRSYSPKAFAKSEAGVSNRIPAAKRDPAPEPPENSFPFFLRREFPLCRPRPAAQFRRPQARRRAFSPSCT